MGLLAAAVLTVGFLIGQVIAWRELSAGGYFLTTNAATASSIC